MNTMNDNQPQSGAFSGIEVNMLDMHLLEMEFDPNVRRFRTTVSGFGHFKLGDIILGQDGEEVAVMVGWRDNDSLWRYDYYLGDEQYTQKIFTLPEAMASAFLPADVARMAII